MPSNILNADIRFPNFTEKETTDEKVEQIVNYLYMVLEQLRYSMGNLDADNFNETGLDEIGKTITEPLTIRLDDDEENIASLSLVSAQLWAKYEDAEENIAQLTITAGGLVTRVSDVEGNVNTLTETSTALSSRLSTAEGNISTLTQTADSLSTRISDTEGNVSTLSQTVNGMGLSVSNGAESSTISLTRNGVAVSSQNISFTGVVTFTDLRTASGTVINGANISTGSITGDKIRGGTITGCTIATILESSGSVGGEIKMFYLLESNNFIAGGMRLDDQGGGADTAKYRMFLYTNTVGSVAFALKIQAAGNMSLESGGNMYLNASGSTGVSIAGAGIYLVGNVYINGVLQ